jgi:hypothetical protein
MKKLSNVALLLVLTCAFTACNSNIRHTIGLKRQVPDAFKVVSNPPLSVPPEFSTLPVPQPGKPVPGQDMQKQAYAALFPSSHRLDTQAPTSSGESTLLARAKANEADPNIASILNADQRAAEQKAAEKNIVERVIAKVSPTNHSEPVVNAPKEKQRIVQNKKEGKPVSSGRVPEVETTSHGGLLKKVFGL